MSDLEKVPTVVLLYQVSHLELTGTRFEVEF